MRTLVLAGLVLGGIAATPVAMAGEPGRNGTGSAIAAAGAHGMAPGHVWGRRIDGRWAAGANAPGGWVAYRRPVNGVSLPGYWINPAYYIADHAAYGLPAPAYGYGWSRYYDDAVLTDRYGRVADARYGYDWDRYGGYDDERPYREEYRAAYRDEAPRRDTRTGSTVLGAVAGGVVGGIAGSAIAGSGNRGTGALIGAGVGAIAGGALGNAAGRDALHRQDARRNVREERADRDMRRLPYDDDGARGAPYAHRDTAPSLNGRVAYDGQWVGTWYGADGTAYSGTYDGRFDGTSRGEYRGEGYYREDGYREEAYRGDPVQRRALPPQAMPYGYGSSGYATGTSYSYTQTDVVPALVTTTVTEETIYSTVRKAVRKPVRRVVRARPRPTCCSCGC